MEQPSGAITIASKEANKIYGFQTYLGTDGMENKKKVPMPNLHHTQLY